MNIQWLGIHFFVYGTTGRRWSGQYWYHSWSQTAWEDAHSLWWNENPFSSLDRARLVQVSEVKWGMGRCIMHIVNCGTKTLSAVSTEQDYSTSLRGKVCSLVPCITKYQNVLSVSFAASRHANGIVPPHLYSYIRVSTVVTVRHLRYQCKRNN